MGGGEFLPVQRFGAELDCQQPGLERVAAGDVFAGVEDQPARRLYRLECRVRAHPAAAGAVALGAQHPVCLVVCALDVGVCPGGGEVVDDEEGVFGGEREPLQRVRGACPGGGQVACVQTGPEVLLGERGQLGLACPGRSGQVQ